MVKVVKVTYVHAVKMAAASLRTRRKCLTTPPHRGLSSERLPGSAARPQRDPTWTVLGPGGVRIGLRAIVRSTAVGARVKAFLSSVMITAVLAVSLAPTSVADATANLRSQVDAARGGCPPLQSDPVLNDVAQRANGETQSYIEHTARFEPFEDPMPVLRDLGYKAGKAKLIPGYADIEAKATRGVIVHGWQAIPDCTYTKYGVNVLEIS